MDAVFAVLDCGVHLPTCAVRDWSGMRAPLTMFVRVSGGHAPHRERDAA